MELRIERQITDFSQRKRRAIATPYQVAVFVFKNDNEVCSVDSVDGARVFDQGYRVAAVIRVRYLLGKSLVGPL